MSNYFVSYRHCIRCGRTIKHPERMIDGMGRVCHSKYLAEQQAMGKPIPGPADALNPCKDCANINSANCCHCIGQNESTEISYWAGNKEDGRLV